MFCYLFQLWIFIATIISLSFGDDVVRDRKLRFVAKQPFGQIEGTDTQNFKELLKSDLYFDKTIVLEKIIVNSYKYKTALIILPTKWGKSLTLNMMKTFFEIQVDEVGNRIPLENTTNYKLFRKNELIYNEHVQQLAQPLYISENKDLLVKYQGQYPVICLNFQNVNGSSYEDFVQRMGEKIKEAFAQHKYMLTRLRNEFNAASSTQMKQIAKEKYDFFLKMLTMEGQISAVDLIISVEFLSGVLYEHFDSKVFILVDNYEGILFSGLVNPDVSQTVLSSVLDLFSYFLLQTLEKNYYLKMGILTGTFHMQNLVSNFTNMIEYTECYHQMITTCGITIDGIAHICKYFRIPDHLSSKAINWYIGYRRGSNLNQHLYSPHSIVNFLSTKKLNYYKTRNVIIDSILENIFENSKLRINILWLLYGESILSPKTIRPEQSLKNFLELKEFLLSNTTIKNTCDPKIFTFLPFYLRGTGILGVRSLMGDFGSTLRLPNNEVRMEISEKLMNFYKRKFQISSELLEKAVENMALFISNRDLDCAQLETFLQSLIDNEELTRDLTRRQQDDKQIFDLFFCYVFNYLTFRITLTYDYNIQSIEKIKSNHWILFNDQQAVFIQFRFNATSADHVLNICKSHAATQLPFSNSEQLKFIGINFSKIGEVQIRVEFQAGPMNLSDADKLMSREEICFSPYSIYKPVIFPE